MWCWGNGRFAHFIEQHRINSMIIEKEITSLMIVTDRDTEPIVKISSRINGALSQSRRMA